MDFFVPCEKGFTIYTKSGCVNCTKVKNLLKERNREYIMVDCDEYLFDFKEDFLEFIERISQVKHRTFPIVFNDGVFIGGFDDTLLYVDKLLSFDENF